MVSPSLPTGLEINSTTCVISGTPTGIQSVTNYTVTASNNGGSVATSIQIEVGILIVSMPTGLLKTGQTTAYQSGDDGTYQKGIARTFVTGGTTGLLWQKCSAGQSNYANCSGTAQTYAWDGANSYCISLNLSGKTWRLPTINELKSLVDYGKSSAPAIDTAVFPNTQSAGYWSSSSGQERGYAWFVDFYGVVGYIFKTNNLYVRCVTGP